MEFPHIDREQYACVPAGDKDLSAVRSGRTEAAVVARRHLARSSLELDGEESYRLLSIIKGNQCNLSLTSPFATRKMPLASPHLTFSTSTSLFPL